MSSSYNYNPKPTRAWSRVQNQCTYIAPNSSYNQAYIPLTNQTVSQAQANYEDKLMYKGNILQYKGNSSRLTKQQRYSQLAKGFGPNRTKVFATQSETYSNPNTTGLLRVNYSTFPFPNQIVGAPNNISGPYQYDVPNPAGCAGTLIKDGGNLVCGTYANPCTGKIIKTTPPEQLCYPSYCSDVPGTPIELCWNPKISTWFPRQRYFMNNSTNKWPEGYKGLVSATTPSPPFLSLLIDASNNTSVTLSWTNVSNNCIPISSYNIYQNGILIQTVPYQITSTIINNLTSCTEYSFYVTSVSNSIESLPSNTVVFETPFEFVNGTYSYDGTNYTVTFTSAGQITFICPPKNLQVVIVGGGGGGGNEQYLSGGGGGGGQAVIPFYTPNLSNKTFIINQIGTAGLGAISSGNSGSSGASTTVTDPNSTSYIVSGGQGGSYNSTPIGIGGTYSGPYTTSYGESITLYGSGGNGGIGQTNLTNGQNSYFKTSSYFLINTIALGGGGGGCGTGGTGGGVGGSVGGNGVGGVNSIDSFLTTQDAVGFGSGGGAYSFSYNPPKRGGNGTHGICIFYFQYP